MWSFYICAEDRVFLFLKIILSLSPGQSWSMIKMRWDNDTNKNFYEKEGLRSDGYSGK